MKAQQIHIADSERTGGLYALSDDNQKTVDEMLDFYAELVEAASCRAAAARAGSAAEHAFPCAGSSAFTPAFQNPKTSAFSTIVPESSIFKN